MAFGEKNQPKTSLHHPLPFVVSKPLGGSAVCAHIYIYIHTHTGGTPFFGEGVSNLGKFCSSLICWRPPQCSRQKAGEEKAGRCFNFEKRGWSLRFHRLVQNSSAGRSECPKVSPTPVLALQADPSCPSLACKPAPAAFVLYCHQRNKAALCW